MRLVVVGAAGRMGCALIRALLLTPGANLAGAIEREGSPALGQDAGALVGLPETGIKVSADPLAAFSQAEGVLDFTSPAATVEFAGLAAQARIVHVIGTTGFDEEHIQKLDAAARHAVLIRSGNMSLGVNLLAALVQKAAAALPDFDIEILEMHHRAKVDAPSGTALLLGEAAAAGRKVGLADAAVRVRDGQTGARVPGTIGFATLRGGSVVGEHTVILAGAGERIELGHKAEDRAIFATGAIKAALWGMGRPPGHYSMADVLGIADL
jgi:4-hydroxy-tetrahydrodipicolinate reductase